MGEGGEDQDPRHEAESTGRQGVYGLDREEVLCEGSWAAIKDST